MIKNYMGSYCLAFRFFLFLCFSTTLPAFAQDYSPPLITGQVTDANGPLAGANVLIKGAAQGTITDTEGHYSLRANATDTLLFTYLGYLPKTVAVNGRSTINVVLREDAMALDAVVINAGYYKVSDKEKTGSIARVTAAEIENQPVDNPLATMQGRLTGVNISPTTGVAGGGYTVTIRGKNSISAGNEPLFVIDGLPYNSSSLSDQNLSGGILPGGELSPLSMINPNDIESIEVLKDADATAIYGSRGANGVILITMKKGKTGSTRYAVSTTTGVAHYSRPVKTLNTQQYIRMRMEAFANDGITELPDNAYDVNGTWDLNRYTDWQKELIGETASFRTLEASVSGGWEETHFLISAGHRKETSVFIGDSEYARTTVRTQLNHASKDSKFNIGFTAGYSLEDNDLPMGDLTFVAAGLPPNAPSLYGEGGELNWENGTFDNPLAPLNANYASKRNTLVSSLELNYRLFKGLVLKSRFGYQDSRLEERRNIPHTIYNPAYGFDSSFSSVDSNQGSRNSWIAEPQLNYTHLIGGGTLDVIVGGSFQNEKDRGFAQLAVDFPSNELMGNLAAASLQFIVNDNTTEYRYEALFGRINYNFKNKYILNLTGRRDGSSRFGPGNRLANFGAVGAAWLFGEEQFVVENLPILSHGKLRGSYGSTGNDRIGDYQYLDTYTVSGNQYNGIPGLSPTQLFNPDFGWEINKKAELALELGFFKDRIAIETNYYHNRSSNQLVGIPLPATTGFASIQANLGATVENTGWELSLRTKNVNREAFQWNTNFNITVPKNKLVAFPGLEESTYSNQYEIGQPLTILKLYHFLGVDPQTGVYQFEDYNQDGTISSPDDMKYVVDTAPKFYGGLENSFTYGKWQFDFFLQFSKQRGYNYWYGGSPAGIMANQPAGVLDHWQEVGDTGATQLYTSGENSEAFKAFYNFSNSSAAFSDASYIRLKNVSLSYSLPIEGIHCSIFIEAQNLLTLTKYKGGDPEQLSGFLPPLRKYSGGLQLSF